MDNRRPSGSAPTTPYNQSRQYKTDGERRYRGDSQSNNQTGGEYRKFTPRDNNYQQRNNDDRFRRPNDRFNENNRPDTRERFDSRERPAERFPRRENNQFRANEDNRFRPANDRFQRNDNFQPNNRFQKSDRPQSNDRFQRSDRPQSNDRFQKNDRYQSNDRFRENRPDKFQQNRGFTPKPKANDWKTAPRPKIYDEMQVTDGKHIGKFLKTTASDKVRPTARRIREVMFRLIFRRVRARRFLDLCAGSGTVGIEAISRGALLCTFVERSAKMCGFIRKNMETLSIKEGHGEIHEIEVVPFLKRMQKRKRNWDVVFFDPPYDTNYDEVLEFFKRGVAIRPGGLLVIEHHAEMFFPETIGILRRAKVINQGETSLSFYERKL